MTNSAFRPLTAAEQIFKSLIWDPLVLSGEKLIEAELPLLAAPVVSNLEEAAVNAIADWAFNNLILLVDITAIKFNSAGNQTAFDTASAKLQVIAIDSGVDSQEFKNARIIEQDDFIKFIHFNAG